MDAKSISRHGGNLCHIQEINCQPYHPRNTQNVSSDSSVQTSRHERTSNARDPKVPNRPLTRFVPSKNKKTDDYWRKHKSSFRKKIPHVERRKREMLDERGR